MIEQVTSIEVAPEVAATVRAQPVGNAGNGSLAALLDLSRRARHARDMAELTFMAVNDTHALAPYRQAALWSEDVGLRSLSGVVQIEANAPYAQWLERVFRHVNVEGKRPHAFDKSDLPEDLAADWDEWLPEHAMWLPLAADRHVKGSARGALLLVRDLSWTEQEGSLLVEWMDVWNHAWQARFKPPLFSLRIWKARVASFLRPEDGARGWWKSRPLWITVIVLGLLFYPMRLSVLAPGELVPAKPAVVRAPLEGVIESFAVRPNQIVKKGQLLFSFDEALIQSRLEVGRQTMATAEAEYRQTAQQALSDVRSKAQMALLSGKIREKRAEVEYLEEQLTRARVLSPQDGIVLVDDPSEWIGRPVAVGERIMRIAIPEDKEIEVWVAMGDAIPLKEGASASLYLNASPLAPVKATLRYVSHDAVQRPDGSYAYRVRAQLEDATEHRVGLKGTAKLYGERVPFAYWLVRRPLATIRSTLGL
ncbi:efflux RND transporter periplasmic adaptor subunit [Lacisediminimonas sp.]|uniref:efflux RND transporter periplasmic adaptor subunit n=1 Tax=Lacisediminimonas sp. TaxID=3060582 RepID=UPI00272908B5|nr:HlyD family efflux transporter periplasmic adaptor subunit [Lacisediminimonas sp.]MDO8301512.1 HlyD family efflux transporter periplasmic adaptor subunit [Lacisediminimonas sp.]MDO9217529.1 HlyD family efflux transporter periplasmic adaptor subunit [Lacisediminimonas sp.]